MGNRFSNITLGNGLKTIGAYAFNNSMRTEIELTLPDSVTSIGSSAFAANPTLTKLKLGNSVETIGQNAFEDCGLTSAELPTSLRRISNDAFRNNKLTSVVIPEGVTYIGFRAFANNPITEVVIPSSLVDSRSIRQVIIQSDSFPNTITRVTLPQGLGDLGWLDVNLRNFYNSQNRAAGTYVKNGPVWTLQPVGLQ